MADLIDIVAQSSGDRAQAVRQALIDEIVAYWARYLGRPDRLLQLQQVNMQGYLLELADESGVFDPARGAYDDVIADVRARIATIPEDIANSLRRQNEQRYRKQLRDVADELDAALLESLVSRSSIAELTSKLTAATELLADYQINAIVNTALRTTSRTVFAEGTQELPEDTKYRYVGPLDSVTRDVCREALERQGDGVTRAEIRSLPVDMVNGGGWNCRHRFEVVV